MKLLDKYFVINTLSKLWYGLLPALRGSLVVVVLAVGLYWVNYVWFMPFTPASFFERAYIEYLKTEPELATASGVKSWLLPNGFGGQLSDNSLRGDSIRRQNITRYLELLDTYKDSDLSADQKVSVSVLRRIFTDLYLLRPEYKMPVNCLDGDHIVYQQFMVVYHQIKTINDATEYTQRLSALAKRLVYTARWLRDCEMIPPTAVLAEVSRQLHVLADENPKVSLLYRDFNQKLSKIYIFNELAKQEVMIDFDRVMVDELQPAYRELARAVEQAMTQSPQEPETDSDYFLYHAARQGTDDFDDSADDELSEQSGFLLEEISRLAVELGFSPNTPLATLWKFLDNDQPKTPISIRAGQFLKKLDSLNLAWGLPEISRVNFIFHSNNQPFAIEPLKYFPSPGERGVILVDAMREYAHFELEALLLAEVFPGRHFQQQLANANPDLPLFQKMIELPAFSSAWKVFALELAYRKTGWSAKDRLAILRLQLSYAYQGLCDTKLNTGQMSIAEAEAILIENLGFSPQRAHSVVLEILCRPGRASAYISSYKALQDWYELVCVEQNKPLSVFVSKALALGCLPTESFNKWMKTHFLP